MGDEQMVIWVIAIGCVVFCVTVFAAGFFIGVKVGEACLGPVTVFAPLVPDPNPTPKKVDAGLECKK